MKILPVDFCSAVLTFSRSRAFFKVYKQSSVPTKGKLHVMDIAQRVGGEWGLVLARMGLGLWHFRKVFTEEELLKFKWC